MSSHNQFPKTSSPFHHYLDGMGSSFAPSPLEFVAARQQIYGGPSSPSHGTIIPDSQMPINQVAEVIEGSLKIVRPIQPRSTSGCSRTAAFIDPLTRKTVFVNKMKMRCCSFGRTKFSNELPDPTDQPKLLKSSSRSYDGFTQYRKSSLEQHHRPELYVEPDLGIPLDLLDQSALIPPKGVRLSLAPEDEELLGDDDVVTPIEKKDGLKKRQRPDAESISWLLKSPHRPSHLRIPLDIPDRTALNRAKDLPSTPDGEDEELLGDHNLLIPVEKSGLNKKQHPKAGLIARLLKSHHRPFVTMDARNKRHRSAARRRALAVTRRRRRVINCALQARVMQDYSRNHDGNVEHNATRPRRARKKPAYLADYELY